MKKRHEVLFNQLETYRSEILGVASTVSEEEAGENSGRVQ